MEDRRRSSHNDPAPFRLQLRPQSLSPSVHVEEKGEEDVKIPVNHRTSSRSLGSPDPTRRDSVETESQN